MNKSSLITFVFVSLLSLVSFSQDSTDEEQYGSIYQKKCTETMYGAHGCPPQTGAKGILNNALSGRLGTKGCTAGCEVFEYPASSKNFICYHLPSREAWNVKYGATKGYDSRHPNAPIPNEDEKDDCTKWGRPIQRTYDGCE